MKKQLAMLVALLLVIAVAVPAFAAVEFKYGGQMRVRYIADNNLLDGSDSFNDNENFVDQRLRLYFTFAASENLKIVWKMEMGDTTWGRSGGRLGPGGGGEPGADSVSVENKNIYMEFNIPGTMLTADVGIQTLTLLNSWIVDDDFAAAVLKANLDPFKVAFGYVAGQTAGSTVGNLGGPGQGTTNDITWQDRVDSWYVSADYKGGPFAGSLVGYYQDGRNTNASVDPSVMVTPFTNAVPNFNNPVAGVTAAGPDGVALPNNTFGYVKDQFGNASDFSFLRNQFGQSGLFGTTGGVSNNFDHGYIKDNNLFDLGFNFEYKQSWMSAYVSFVKNLGSLDVVALDGLAAGTKKSVDYTGFMADAGANFFCGPYTFNVGGFYTTGDELNGDGTTFKNPDEVNRFAYPMSTQKYFSEIMGGGILDNNQNIAHTRASGVNGNPVQDFQWEAYGFPSNIWTVTAGAAWQVLEKTKVSASYWYFGTSEDVLGAKGKFANDIGHELDLYVTQGIVDGLTLDLVGAYLITGDAYTSAVADPDNVYEVGARLQWNF